MLCLSFDRAGLSDDWHREATPNELIAALDVRLPLGVNDRTLKLSAKITPRKAAVLRGGSCDVARPEDADWTLLEYFRWMQAGLATRFRPDDIVRLGMHE